MNLEQSLSNRTTPVGKIRGLIAYLSASNAALSAALAGDLELIVSPVTLGSSADVVNDAIADDGKFVRSVQVVLQTADGDVHNWFSGELEIAATKTGAGTVAIAGGATTVQLEMGVGLVVLEYTGTWAAAATQTLTVTGIELAGVELDDVTSVDTLVA